MAGEFTAAAVALITRGRGLAAVAGLERPWDVAGKRADLTRIDDSGQWPFVVQTLTAA